MVAGQRRHEGLVVQSSDGQTGIGKRLGHDGAIYFTGAQHFQQLDSEVFLQHQRHLRRHVYAVAHQFGQQVGCNGVDHPQTQRTSQWVFAAFGYLFDIGRLLQHALRLPDDVFAQGGDRDFIGTALEQFDL